MDSKVLSLQLYQFLTSVVGSEKIIKARRNFFKVLDHGYRFSPKWNVVNSGSKAEGLDLPGSDLDIMYIDNDGLVYTNESQIPSMKSFGLVIDTTNTSPGFVHIRVIKNLNDAVMPEFEYYENEKVLSNNTFKTMGKKYTDPLEDDSDDSTDKNIWPELESIIESIYTPIHGPCTSTFCGSFDFLYCYKYETWPKVAYNWIFRTRLHDWPSCDLISNILQEDVLLVPIGSKFNSEEENPIEWRLSFSIAEKLLIQSFHHTQMLCYAMLKIVLKEIIQKTELTKDILCSYFIKTVLFWTIEEFGCSMWHPANFYFCFQISIHRLAYYIRCNNLPNYFVSENNMFARKILGNRRKYLLDMLKSICNGGMQPLYQSVTIKAFMAYNNANVFSFHQQLRTISIDSAIYPFLPYLRGIPGDSIMSLYKPLYLILHCRRLGGFFKQACLLWLTRVCGCLAKEDDTMNNKSQNKSFYEDYRGQRSIKLMGTNTDSISGWLVFATFLLEHQEIQSALAVLNFVYTVYSSDKNLITFDLKSHPDVRILHKLNLSFFKRYIFSCFDYIYFLPKDSPQTVFLLMDPNTFARNSIRFIHMPRPFTYYLLFRCHEHLGSRIEQEQALELLIQCTASSQWLEEQKSGIVLIAVSGKIGKILKYWPNILLNYLSLVSKSSTKKVYQGIFMKLAPIFRKFIPGIPVEKINPLNFITSDLVRAAKTFFQKNGLLQNIR